jgi:hypothetical protein
MIKLKEYAEYSAYDYGVCEIEKCPNAAEKIYLNNHLYLEICFYHYDELMMA